VAPGTLRQRAKTSVPQQQDNSEQVEVRLYRWAMVDARRRIGLTGVDPCVAVGVLNDSRGLAWLAHAPSVAKGRAELVEMLRHALETSDMAHDIVRLAVGGNGAELVQARTEAELDRDRVLELLGAYCPRLRPALNWASAPRILLAHQDGRWRDAGGARFAG
jgi:hypothetical protein